MSTYTDDYETTDEPDLDSGHADDTEAPSTPPDRPARRKGRVSAERKKVLGLLQRRARLADVDLETLGLLAASLGCDADPDQVTAWSVTPGPAAGALAALSDLRDNAAADPLDAMVAAAGMAADRDLLRTTWSLLSCLGAVDSAAPARKPVPQLARDLVRATQSLTDDQALVLSAAQALLDN